MCLSYLDEEKLRQFAEELEKARKKNDSANVAKKSVPTATNAAAANWRRRGRRGKSANTGAK